MAIGDTHFPFHDVKALKWVIKKAAEWQPDYIVQVGDLYDYLMFSRFARSLDLMTPKQEATLGREAAEEMWAGIRKAAPEAELWQIRGNHDIRAEKQLMDRLPEAECVVDFGSRFGFEGVNTLLDTKEELFFGDVCIQHGFRKKGEHAKHNQCPTIVGHLHTGDVVYYTNRYGMYWELNAGFMGDLESPVFGYRNQKKIHGWTVGCGRVDHEGPRFVHFPG